MIDERRSVHGELASLHSPSGRPFCCLLLSRGGRARSGARAPEPDSRQQVFESVSICQCGISIKMLNLPNFGSLIRITEILRRLL